jgi:hypothetical protein
MESWLLCDPVHEGRGIRGTEDRSGSSVVLGLKTPRTSRRRPRCHGVLVRLWSRASTTRYSWHRGPLWVLGGIWPQNTEDVEASSSVPRGHGRSLIPGIRDAAFVAPRTALGPRWSSAAAHRGRRSAALGATGSQEPRESPPIHWLWVVVQFGFFYALRDAPWSKHSARAQTASASRDRRRAPIRHVFVLSRASSAPRYRYGRRDGRFDAASAASSWLPDSCLGDHARARSSACSPGRTSSQNSSGSISALDEAFGVQACASGLEEPQLSAHKSTAAARFHNAILAKGRRL